MRLLPKSNGSTRRLARQLARTGPTRERDHSLILQQWTARSQTKGSRSAQGRTLPRKQPTIAERWKKHEFSVLASRLSAFCRTTLAAFLLFGSPPWLGISLLIK